MVPYSSLLVPTPGGAAVHCQVVMTATRLYGHTLYCQAPTERVGLSGLNMKAFYSSICQGCIAANSYCRFSSHGPSSTHG